MGSVGEDEELEGAGVAGHGAGEEEGVLHGDGGVIGRVEDEGGRGPRTHAAVRRHPPLQLRHVVVRASARFAGAVAAVAAGVPVHAVSAHTGAGMDTLRGYIPPDNTVALLGSSGVGKSSIVNLLLGRDQQVIGEVRADG